MGQYTLVLITGRHGIKKYGSVGKSDGVIGSKTKVYQQAKKVCKCSTEIRTWLGKGCMPSLAFNKSLGFVNLCIGKYEAFRHKRTRQVGSGEHLPKNSYNIGR